MAKLSLDYMNAQPQTDFLHAKESSNQTGLRTFYLLNNQELCQEQRVELAIFWQQQDSSRFLKHKHMLW
jgi:hypothetical protein